MRRRPEPVEDVLKLMAEHHRTLSAALCGLAEARQTSSRRLLVETLERALRSHMSYEEQVLHPLLQTLDPELAHESELEHHEIYDMLAHLARADPSGPKFQTLVALLAGLVEAHASDEERSVLPLLHGRPELDDLPLPTPLW